MSKSPAPRLYLVTPPLADSARFLPALEAALGEADIAAVLLRLDAAGAAGAVDERTLINRTKAIAAVVQRRDVALVLDGHAELAARTGADGAHLTGIETFAAALALLKPERIAGAGGLRSRHDAMLAAEAGADYVMFGEPDRNGRRLSFAETVERLTWWADLLEVPCVAYAASTEEVAPLAQTGADFVALGDWLWREPQVAAALAAASAAMAAAAKHDDTVTR